MESEDRIVAALQQLHDDLEKLRGSVEKNYEQAAALNKRLYRRMLAVYLAVIGGFVLWSLLSQHR